MSIFINSRLTNMWDKTSDFLMQHFSYKATDKACLVIKINLLANDKTLLVELPNSDKATLFKEFLSTKKIATTYYPLKDMAWEKIKITNLSDEEWVIFFKELFNYEPLTKEIIIELSTGLDIKNGITDLSKLIESPEQTITRVKFAQDQGNEYDSIWELAQLYYEDGLKKETALFNTDIKDESLYNIDKDVLYDLLKHISEKSPHYAKAQDLCVGLLMRLDLNHVDASIWYSLCQ